MDVYRVTGVNHLGSFGRWAFAEFRDVGEIESDFAANVEAAFDGMMDAAMQSPGLNLSA